MQDAKNKSKQKDAVKELNRALNSYTSLKRQFLRGVFYGIGVFFGATVGIGIIVTILYWSVPRLKVIPIIGGFASDVVEFVQINLENNNKYPSNFSR